MKLVPILFLLSAGWAWPLLGDSPAPGFDHSHHQWDALLQRYVVGSTVRYRVWARDRGGLDAYVRSFTRVTGEQFAEFTEPQKLAFWINAYNAFTIQVVLDHYPIRPHLLSLSPANSIRQISGVWDDFYLEAGGGRYSLNQIEHEILRAKFGEPRIHVAINCASVGCPPLRQEAYRASRIEERAPVFSFPERCARVDVVYNSGIRRYLMALAFDQAGGWGLFDAPEPWGPWTTAFFTTAWDLGPTHGYRLPSKWIDRDGEELYIVSSGRKHAGVNYDAFSVRRLTLHLLGKATVDAAETR